MHTMKRLPGLDFIRFYAALSVVVFHTSLNPQAWFDHPVVMEGLPPVFLNGGDAVTLFFVLSGFLITYLLISEKKKTLTIDVKAFYKRRALRILPLYYTVVFLGYVVIPLLFPNAPAHPPPEGLIFFLLLVPNVATSVVWRFVIAHLWSIGIEELYYWFIPALVKLVKWLPLLLFSVIIGRWVLYAIADTSGNEHLITFATAARFDCMAIGGLGAYLVSNRHFLLRILYHPVLQRLAIGLFIFNLLYSNTGAVYDTLKACVFTVYILNVATNPLAIGRIETRWTPLLGAWSYGMYMFHVFVIYILALLLPIGSDVVFMVASITLTILIAAASYRWLEIPFLRLKDRAVAKNKATSILASSENV